MIALVRRSGSHAGERIEVTGEVVLGRESASVDIAIDDPEVSRRHLVLRPCDEGVELEDLGSSNGTFVDGERLSAPVLVSRLARITLGNTTLDVEVEQLARAVAVPAGPPDAPAGGLAPGPQRSFEPGDVVGGRFELAEKIGEGGMGQVFEAVDRTYDRRAAVKVLADEMAEDIEFRLRFEREATAAERVTHPNVLPVWAHGEDGGVLYLATPLCDTDLARLLVGQGRLAPDRALAIMAQVAWALDWAHGRGVVHRDVKPDNIFLVIGTGGDHAYLADFGLAKGKFDATLTRAGRAAGFTPDYAAPEQWRAGEIGPATDQYALAATLFTCLAGRPPFRRRHGRIREEAHLDEAPPLLTEVVRGIPENLAAAVARGLAADPAERFGTCAEFVAAARADGPPTAAAPPVVRSTGRRRARRAALSAGAVALVAGAVLAVVLAMGGSKSPTGTGPGPAQQIAVGTDPLELAADSSGVWVANHGSDSVSRIAPVTGALLGKAIGAVAQPLGVAVNDGLVWVAGPDGQIASLDARTGRRLSSVNLRRQVDGIAAAFGAVWTFNGTAGTVTRSDVRNGRLGRRRTVKVGVGTSDIVAGPGGVWVANSASATLVQLVPGTGVIARTVRLRHAIGGVALDAGAVWTASPTEGRIVRVGTDSRVAQTFSVGPIVAAADVAAGDGAVFYIDRGDGSVTRVDPATGRRVGARVRLVKQPGAAVVSAHALWVTDRASGTVARLGF